MHAVPLRPLPPLAILAACAQLSCAAGAADRADVSRRDSAGVEIVENDAGLAAAPGQWLVSPDPVAEIGAVDGDAPYQLFRVTSAALLGDGRIVVANAGTHEIRFYDSRGMFLRSVGHAGEGPGEFRSLYDLWAGPGDSIHAWDFQLRRMSTFTPEGSFAGTRQARMQQHHYGIGTLDDGSLVAGAPMAVQDPGPDGILEAEMLVLRDDPAKDVIDTIGRHVHSRAGLVEIPGVTTRAARPLVFSSVTSADAAGSRIAVSTGRDPEVWLYQPVDGRITVVRWNDAAVPVSDADGDAFAQIEIERAPDEMRPRMRQRFENERFAEHFPFAGRVELDADGRLWVEHWLHPHAEDPPMWTVFAPDGSMLATVELPRGFHLLDVRGDVVVGRVRDELDVEQVRVYTLIRSSDDDGGGG